MTLMRKVLLAGSTNAWLRDRATQYGFVKRSVKRFWPGERVEDALRAADELKPEGISTILTKLGENLTRAEEAEEVTQHYLDVLDKVAASGLDAQISIKPTQLGLDFDRALCDRNLDRLIARVVEVFGAARAHHGYRFANARGTRVKLVVHDGFGVWCAARRLNQGRFIWPSLASGAVSALTQAQFEALVLGLPWQRLQHMQVITHV